MPRRCRARGSSGSPAWAAFPSAPDGPAASVAPVLKLVTPGVVNIAVQGRVRVKANTDEGLPMSPEQKRAWCESIMEMAEKQKRGHILVDLDGTLAIYNGYVGPTHIGEPVPKMLERVKSWLADGKTVKIFTARAHPAHPDHGELPPVVSLPNHPWTGDI